MNRKLLVRGLLRLALPVWCALAIPAVSRAAEGVSDVHIRVVNGFGWAVPGATVKVIDLWNRRDVTEVFGDFSASRLPYGEYRVSAQSPRWITEERTVIVDRPQLDITIGMRPSPVGDPVPAWEDFEVRGRVIGGASAEEELWIEFVPLYLSGTVRTSVSASGGFNIERVPAGAYLVVLMRGNRPLGAVPVQVKADTGLVEISIDDAWIKMKWIEPKE